MSMATKSFLEAWTERYLNDPEPFEVVQIRRYGHINDDENSSWGFQRISWTKKARDARDRQWLANHYTMGLLGYENTVKFCDLLGERHFGMLAFDILPKDLQDYIWDSCVPLEWKSHRDELGNRVGLWVKQA